jgi:hypothetical protein
MFSFPFLILILCAAIAGLYRGFGILSRNSRFGIIYFPVRPV